MRTAENGGLLVGVGVGITLVVLLVLQSFTGSGLFGTKTVTTTVTSTQQPTELISGLFAQHILALESRNVSSVVGQYERNATVTWASEGECECNSLDGSYRGAANITLIMRQLLLGVAPNGFDSTVSSFVVENLTKSVSVVLDSTVTVNSTFYFVEQSVAFGKIDGTVSAQDYYIYSTAIHTWLISREMWGYLSYGFQTAIAGFSSRPVRVYVPSTLPRPVFGAQQIVECL